MLGRLLFALLLFFAAAQQAVAKKVAFSFDDVPRFAGPLLNVEVRRAMLIAGLHEARVEQAVFFVNPGKLANPDDPAEAHKIMDYANAGHAIANHSYTHRKLSNVTLIDYLADLDAAARWLEGRKGFRPWYRFPFLDEAGSDRKKRDAMRQALIERGLSNGYATADSYDWHILNLWRNAVRAGRQVDQETLKAFFVGHHIAALNFMDALAQKALGRSPVHVLLLHETDLSALFVADLADALRADGWEIVTADVAYADRISALQPDAPSAQGITHIEAIAWEKGLPTPRRYPYCNKDLLTNDFNRRVLDRQSSRGRDGRARHNQ